MILPHLTLVETESPEWILGKKIGHYAHKADVVRLLAMKYSGGIYLDIDVFV
jgi:mannosyltransferase OCH1-like enzyme